MLRLKRWRGDEGRHDTSTSTSLYGYRIVTGAFLAKQHFIRHLMLPFVGIARSFPPCMAICSLAIAHLIIIRGPEDNMSDSRMAMAVGLGLGNIKPTRAILTRTLATFFIARLHKRRIERGSQTMGLVLTVFGPLECLWRTPNSTRVNFYNGSQLDCRIST